MEGQRTNVGVVDVGGAGLEDEDGAVCILGEAVRQDEACGL